MSPANVLLDFCFPSQRKKMWGSTLFVLCLALPPLSVFSANEGYFEDEIAQIVAEERDAPPGRFPYMCSLKSIQREEHFCEGVLVRSDWVLTAARCVDTDSAEAETSPLVHVGATLTDDPEAELLSAEKTIVHCGWTGDPLEGDDIALIKLNKKSRKPFVRFENSRSFPGDTYQTIGWGRTGNGEGIVEKLLLCSDLEYVPIKVCNEFESFDNKIDERVICVSSPTGNACSGGLGVPLLKANNVDNIAEGDASKDLLVGIRSYGSKARGTLNVPGVYTSVAKYRSWIDKVIDSNGDWNCGLVNKDSCTNEETATAQYMTDTSLPIVVTKISSTASSVAMEIKAKLPQCGAFFMSEDEDESIFDVLSLGGHFSSRPSCLNIAPRRVDCFIRKFDSNFFHIAKQDEEIIAMDSLGGAIIGAPECVSLGKDHMDCFMIGREGPKMWNHPWSASSGFSHWIDQGGTVMDTPSCVTRYESTIECFARAWENGPHMKKYIPSTGELQAYVRLPGYIYAPFSCGSWGGDFIDCIGASTDFRMHHNRYVEGIGFADAWTPLQEYSSFRPTVINPSESTVAVFVVKISGEMAHATFDGTTWSGWNTIPGIIRSSPECIAITPTQLHCFAIGPHNTMLHTTYNGNMWTAWKSSKQQFMDKPSCIHYAVKQIRCYARDERSGLGEIIYWI